MAKENKSHHSEKEDVRLTHGKQKSEQQDLRLTHGNQTNTASDNTSKENVKIIFQKLFYAETNRT